MMLCDIRWLKAPWPQISNAQNATAWSTDLIRRKPRHLNYRRVSVPVLGAPAATEPVDIVSERNQMDIECTHHKRDSARQADDIKVSNEG